MMCVGDYELKTPICKTSIEENTCILMLKKCIYILTFSLESDSMVSFKPQTGCSYAKLFCTT